MDENAARSAPRQILIVEDELMIRLLLEDMLTELGYEVAGAAGRIDDALQLAQGVQIDAAILDVNLNGTTVDPVAEVLAERGVPFVFATGYGDRVLAEHLRDRPILHKPFQHEHLKRALLRMFGGA
jgi:CheY-like chemotaxis protein